MKRIFGLSVATVMMAAGLTACSTGSTDSPAPPTGGSVQGAAADAFPVVPVQKQGDLYWKYDKGDWFRGQAELRAPATESAGGGWEVLSMQPI